MGERVRQRTRGRWHDGERSVGWVVVAGSVLVAVVVALVVRPGGAGDAHAVVTAPRGSGDEATLVLDARAGRVVVRDGAPQGTVLEARGEGAGRSATHTVVDGVHDVRLTGATTTVRLAAGVAWTVRVELGSDDAELDLSALDVRAVEVGGGTGTLSVALPAARGPATAELRAGVDDLHVRLGEGEGARVTVAAGVGSLAVDGERTDGAGPGTERTTTGFDPEVEHWEIALDGGAGSVTVDRAG